MALSRNLGFLGRSFLDSSKVGYLHCSSSVCSPCHHQHKSFISHVPHYANYSRSSRTKVNLHSTTSPSDKLKISLVIKGDNNEKLTLKVGTLAWNYVRYGSLICILSLSTLLVYQIYRWIVFIFTDSELQNSDKKNHSVSFFNSLINSVSAILEFISPVVNDPAADPLLSESDNVTVIEEVSNDYCRTFKVIVNGLYPFTKEYDSRGNTPVTIFLPEIPHVFASSNRYSSENVNLGTINEDCHLCSAELQPDYINEDCLQDHNYLLNKSTNATISSNSAKRFSDSDSDKFNHQGNGQQASAPACVTDNTSCFSLVMPSTLQDSGIDHSFYNTSSASFNLMTKSYSSFDLRNCDQSEEIYAFRDSALISGSCKSVNNLSDTSSVNFSRLVCPAEVSDSSKYQPLHANNKVYPPHLYRLICEDIGPSSPLYSSKSSLSFKHQHRFDALSLADSTHSYCVNRNFDFIRRSPANSHTTSFIDDVLHNRNHSFTSQHRTVLPLSENCSKLERIENHLTTVDKEVRGLEKYLAKQRALRYHKEAEAFLLEMNLKTIRNEFESDCESCASQSKGKVFYQPDYEYEDEFKH